MHPAFGLALPAISSPTPPPVSQPTLWCDVSNYTGPLTPQGCQDLKNAGYVGIIAQAITGLDGNSYTTQQLAAARDHGLRIQGYVFCNHNSSVASRLSMFDGFDVETIWLDVEAASINSSDVDRDLRLTDKYIPAAAPIGLYSGHWVFVSHGWLALTKWSTEGRALWDSRYDGIPDPDAGFVSYGGWNSSAIKQFQGTSSLGSVHGIDLNVMRA